MKKLLTIFYFLPIFAFAQISQRDSRIEHEYRFIAFQESTIYVFELCDSVIRVSYTEYVEDDTAKPILHQTSFIVQAKPVIFWDSANVALIRYPCDPDDYILVYDYAEKEVVCIVKGDPHTDGNIYYSLETVLPFKKEEGKAP